MAPAPCRTSGCPTGISGSCGAWARSSCCINAIYFSANAFIPIYIKSADRADLIAGALVGLNFGQIPASLLILAFARRLEGRAWPFMLSGVLSLAGLGGLVFDIGPMTK